MSVPAEALGRRSQGDRVRGTAFYVLLLVAVTIGFILLGVLLVDVLRKGIGYVDLTLLNEPNSSDPNKAGAGPAIRGTIYMMVLLLLFQPVELLVAAVGEREHGPVAARIVVIRLDFDAPDDAVGPGCRRHLEAVALVAVDLNRLGQVERDVVARNLDRLDGHRTGGGKQRCDDREGERQ